MALPQKHNASFPGAKFRFTEVENRGSPFDAEAAGLAGCASA
jgi:hypothetical protein